MAQTLRSDTALAASVLGLGLMLVFVGNILLAQWLSAERQMQSPSFEHQLGIAASASGIAITTWWTLSLVFAFVTALLHRVGQRRGADFFSKFSPAFMLRLAVSLMTLNLLGAGMAQAAAPEPGWQPTSASTVEPAHAAWKQTPVERARTTTPSVDDIDAARARVHDPRWQPRPPVIDPGLLSRPSPRPTTPSTTDVVVKTGDSLWSIAAARLGPFATDVEVALTWPKWYDANRVTIGGDPTVLLPGQILRPPSPA